MGIGREKDGIETGGRVGSPLVGNESDKSDGSDSVGSDGGDNVGSAVSPGISLMNILRHFFETLAPLLVRDYVATQNTYKLGRAQALEAILRTGWESGRARNATLVALNCIRDS